MMKFVALIYLLKRKNQFSGGSSTFFAITAFLCNSSYINKLEINRILLTILPVMITKRKVSEM